MTNKIRLLGKTHQEIYEELSRQNLPRYTSKQVCEWIYRKQVQDFSAMTNLSLQTRKLLNENYYVGFDEIIQKSTSIDGTEKYLHKVEKDFIESVYIPEETRGTLCISTQIGCRFSCAFCATGKQGFRGNLSSGDILNQILTNPHHEKITNIVFMGMGEPLDNVDEVIKACTIITASWGLAMSPRRVTISTVGVIKNLERIISETNCNIAISLHSPFADERTKLMPVQKSNPIEKIVEVLRRYNWTGQRRLSFEYVLFEGINDSERHVEGIVRLLKKLSCRVNLINYHITDEKMFKPVNEDKLIWFRDRLTGHGIFTTVRKSRGLDILAACGMLSTKKRNQSD